jgi:hypothetical protein
MTSSAAPIAAGRITRPNHLTSSINHTAIINPAAAAAILVACFTITPFCVGVPSY